jgi:fructose-bisphosphate aldolase class I
MKTIDMPLLADTARRLMADGKGLLAMDESTGTCNRRFGAAGIPQTEAFRRAYRELLVSTPGLGRTISGAILFEETLHQRTRDDVLFTQVLEEAGIVPGIKVDLGAKLLAGHPGERVTEGLDGLRARLKAYSEKGARFAKWRAVFSIETGTPGPACIAANAHALARYAALCQEASLVPIVEPEVLMDGAHTLAECGEATHRVLHQVFEQLDQQGVVLEAMLLKPNMVLPGTECPVQDDIDAVADATLACLLRAVPAAVAGIAFLSGGQPAELATVRLNAMHRPRDTAPMSNPWPLTFSFGRALQQPALAAWAGNDANRVAAQQALLHRAACNGAAVLGRYGAVMETP